MDTVCPTYGTTRMRNITPSKLVKILIASAVSRSVSGNLVKFGANSTTALIPS